jgi:hypothetical protein
MCPAKCQFLILRKTGAGVGWGGVGGDCGPLTILDLPCLARVPAQKKAGV